MGAYLGPVEEAGVVGEGGEVFFDFAFYAAVGEDYCNAEDA